MMFLIQAMVVSLVAGLSAWGLHHHLQRGPVLASAVITLTAGLVLPNMFDQGNDLVAVAACGSYVSMSATIRLRNVLETCFALTFAALLFVASTQIFVGVGGKLGTIAAVSVMTVLGCSQVLRFLPKAAKICSRMF